MTNATSKSDNVIPKPERVGILLVHGIGETKKFENIEAVAKNIAKALESDKRDKREKPLEVRVIINSTDYGEYAASQQTWLADEKGA
ncbi:MAG: hypothetical protein AAF316_11630, partial [Cyanobacteria bacterium P01_A01_bin.80]